MYDAEASSALTESFINDHERIIEPLAKQAALAHWQMQLQGSEENQQASAAAAARIRMVYADRDNWLHLQKIHADTLNNKLLKRQYKLLFTTFKTNQLELQDISQMENLRASLSAKYNQHRAKLNGVECSDNKLDELLANSVDSTERRNAWEASKTVGAVAVGPLLELVRLRNRSAVKLGYRNYYEMALEGQEIEQDELTHLLNELHLGCRPLWERFRTALDENLASRFGIRPKEVMPWHHSNRFFQTVKQPEINLDEVYASTDAVETTRMVFSSMSLPVDDLIQRADLYERPGKCQHAFCLNVDRKGDIRVLCNIVPGERWLTTTLHEVGHAAYDKYINSQLPYLLRRPSHTMTTEAVALFMGRLPTTLSFLQRFSGESKEACEKLARQATRAQLTHQLVFLHWCLVMSHFERELYSNPDQDLNTLWWDLVEHYQRVKRPPNRNQPDWAAKIHFASSPVYYHSYLLGDMMASQITRALVERTSSSVHNLETSPATGEYLRQELFFSGGTMRWDEWVLSATSSPLNAGAFLNDLYSLEAMG